MTLQQAITLSDQLRKEFSGTDNQVAIKTLNQLKLLLAKLGEALEIGAILSIRTKDIQSFERYLAQLKTFYREFATIIPESPRMFMLLGLNLLRLLAQVRISEFHTELENIGSLHLKNIYINHPVSIEQALMEGSYNKVWNARQDVPAQEYLFFMDILMSTIRHEIATCSEKAYTSLPIADAATLLYFKSHDELLEFSKQRNWNIDQKQKKIVFVSGAVDKLDIPTENVIHNVLNYAKELEQIV
ncbi:hypothetical protein HDV01_006095 [Terramyces sp. JEL0728]|nr:hypothetical protein HDV01_006095 [Terramyces sp. JEL0728]